MSLTRPEIDRYKLALKWKKLEQAREGPKTLELEYSLAFKSAVAAEAQ